MFFFSLLFLTLSHAVGTAQRICHQLTEHNDIMECCDASEMTSGFELIQELSHQCGNQAYNGYIDSNNDFEIIAVPQGRSRRRGCPMLVKKRNEDLVLWWYVNDSVYESANLIGTYDISEFLEAYMDKELPGKVEDGSLCFDFSFTLELRVAMLQ